MKITRSTVEAIFISRSEWVEFTKRVETEIGKINPLDYSCVEHQTNQMLTEFLSTLSSVTLTRDEFDDLIDGRSVRLIRNLQGRILMNHGLTSMGNLLCISEPAIIWHVTLRGAQLRIQVDGEHYNIQSDNVEAIIYT